MDQRLLYSYLQPARKVLFTGNVGNLRPRPSLSNKEASAKFILGNMTPTSHKVRRAEETHCAQLTSEKLEQLQLLVRVG